MRRSAHANFHRKDRVWILTPMGRFIGFGGTIGIFPTRLIGPDCDAVGLGKIALLTLADSRSTGYHAKDLQKFSEEVGDADSKRIDNHYFRIGESLTRHATRFATLKLELSESARTLSIRAMIYSAELRSLKGDAKLSVRVSKGPEAIGEAMMSLVK